MATQHELSITQLQATGKYWGKIVRPLARTNYLITGQAEGGLWAISLPGSLPLILPGNTKVLVLSGAKLLNYITEHEAELQSYYDQMPGLRDALETDALA